MKAQVAKASDAIAAIPPTIIREQSGGTLSLLAEKAQLTCRATLSWPAHRRLALRLRVKSYQPLTVRLAWNHPQLKKVV